MDNPPKIELQAPVEITTRMPSIKFEFSQWSKADQIINDGGQEVRVEALVAEAFIGGTGIKSARMPFVASYWRVPSSKLFWFGHTHPLYIANNVEIIGISSFIYGNNLIFESQANIDDGTIEPKIRAAKLTSEAILDPRKFMGVRKAINLTKTVGDEFLMPLDRSSFLCATVVSVKIVENYVYLSLVNQRGEKGTLELKVDSYQLIGFKRD